MLDDGCDTSSQVCEPKFLVLNQESIIPPERDEIMATLNKVAAEKLEIERAYQEDTEALQNLIKNLESDIRNLDNENRGLHDTVEDLSLNLNAESAKSEAQLTQIESLHEQIDNLTRHSETLELLKIEAQAKFDAEKRVRESLEAQLSSKETELSALKAKFDDMERNSGTTHLLFKCPINDNEIRNEGIPPFHTEMARLGEMRVEIQSQLKQIHLERLEFEDFVRQCLALISAARTSDILQRNKENSLFVSATPNINIDPLNGSEIVATIMKDELQKETRNITEGNKDDFSSNDYLYERLVHAEARAAALTNHLESMPQDLQIAVAEKHVLQSKLRHVLAAKDTKVMELKTEMV